MEGEGALARLGFLGAGCLGRSLNSGRKSSGPTERRTSCWRRALGCACGTGLVRDQQLPQGPAASAASDGGTWSGHGEVEWSPAQEQGKRHLGGSPCGLPRQHSPGLSGSLLAEPPPPPGFLEPPEPHTDPQCQHSVLVGLLLGCVTSGKVLNLSVRLDFPTCKMHHRSHSLTGWL